MSRSPLPFGLLLVTLACGGPSRELSPIALDPLPAIGEVDGVGTMSSWPRISPRHPLGYRVMVPQAGAAVELPMVYADDGSLLGSLGEVGDGPGQFIEPLFSRVGPGDSLWIFDGSARASVFTPERVFVRAIALPTSPWDAVVLPDGRLVLASATSGAPLPLLLLDGEGAVIRTIGMPVADEPIGAMRRIVLARDATIWTVPMLGSWRIEHWDTTGTDLGALVRQPEWFPPYRRYQAPAPGIAPQPTLQAAWFDDSGRLWVLGKAVDPQWARGIDTLDARGGEPGQSVISDPDQVYDTMIEVIDLQSGEAIITARFDATWPFVAEPGVLMRVATSRDGAHFAELVRVRER